MAVATGDADRTAGNRIEAASTSWGHAEVPQQVRDGAIAVTRRDSDR
jgi:hypothetical protein